MTLIALLALISSRSQRSEIMCGSRSETVFSVFISWSCVAARPTINQPVVSSPTRRSMFTNLFRLKERRPSAEPKPSDNKQENEKKEEKSVITVQRSDSEYSTRTLEFWQVLDPNGLPWY